MTLVSVALATYNGERYISEQLSSIAAQTRRPDEIVVGDDQSCDSTEDILRRFEAETGIPVRFTCNTERLGSSGNFSAILSRCQGDIILLSDQDDVWAPNRVERSLAELDSRPDIGFVFSDAAFISGSGQPLPGTLWGAYFSLQDQDEFCRGRGWEVMLRGNVVTGATMAIRRNALVEALPVPHGWIHDAWLALFIGYMHGSYPIPEPLISYRLHASQQIGIPSRSPRQILRRIRKYDAAYYRADANNFRVLAERLQLREKSDAAKRVILKSEFLEYRASIRESLWAGMRSLPSSLVRGDYNRYGRGRRQAVLDLIAVAISSIGRARGV